jgi:CRP-like cAMP-binding protein
MEKQRIDEKDRELLSQYGLRDLDLSRAERRVYGQGEYISLAGEPISDLYFVVSGKAKVLISLLSGKQLLLAYFTSRGIIGDMELATNKPTNYTTVRAVTEFVCVTLPLGFYAAELRANNAFVNYVARELAEKLTQRVINGAITTLQPLEARLCAYVTLSASGGYFRETLTEVAEVVGASYRHLLRCLDKLCGKKILAKEASGYRIADQKMLDDIAGDLYVLK